jgi:hypothetical protein
VSAQEIDQYLEGLDEPKRETLAQLRQGYTTSTGALRFDIGQPLPVPLVEKLIAVRLRQAFPHD